MSKVHVHLHDSSFKTWAKLGSAGEKTAETVLRGLLPGSVEVHMHAGPLLTPSSRSRDALTPVSNEVFALLKERMDVRKRMLAETNPARKEGLHRQQQELLERAQRLNGGSVRDDFGALLTGELEASERGCSGPLASTGKKPCGCARCGSDPYVVADEELFSTSQLEALRSEYSRIEGIDPAKPTYTKLTSFLGRLSQGQLKQLAGAGIKFVSGLARNRVRG